MADDGVDRQIHFQKTLSRSQKVADSSWLTTAVVTVTMGGGMGPSLQDAAWIYGSAYAR
jgi:hypothetical protein